MMRVVVVETAERVLKLELKRKKLSLNFCEVAQQTGHQCKLATTKSFFTVTEGEPLQMKNNYTFILSPSLSFSLVLCHHGSS
jgi:hypothetical protein